jgi:hypothetical protein
MSEEEINIAIAEYRGWQILEPEVHKAITYHWAIEPDSSKSILPDYCNDLNAMHDAEKTLSRGQNYHQLYGFGFYVNTLTQICYQQHILTATASQRAEAFVRTIDKWKE